MRNRSIAYPCPDLVSFFGSASPLSRAHQTLRAVGHRWRGRPPADARIALTYHGGDRPPPLAERDVAAIVVTHNERRFLPSLLAHYRRLGIARFLIVDDASVDGTPDFLAEQSDVDLWTSNVRFADAGRGKAWRAALLDLYGRDRWYLIVDADEYLVFDAHDRGLDIPGLVDRLERRGIQRCAAPMLDAYRPGAIAAAVFDGAPGQMPWDVATHVDGDGYTLTRGHTALELTGGPRFRLFGSKAKMMKYPLLRVAPWDDVGAPMHAPPPGPQNFRGIFGALLHFKLFSDIRQQAEYKIENGQHYRGAREYRNIRDHLEAADPDFGYAGSVAIGSSADFVARGFFLPLSEER
jgi:glycosyltransferase involved in cell wall biosynthesis